MRKITTLFALLLMAVIGASAANVAKIGTTEYATLQEAVTAANASGGEIVILADNTNSVDMVIKDNDVTIDLNGKTISFTDNYGFVVKAKKLTVKDTTAGQPTVNTGYTVTYTAGSITAPKYPLVVNANGVFELQSGKIISEQECGIYNGDPNNGSGSVTISGGMVEAQEMGILILCNSTLNVNGGVILTHDNAAVGDNGTAGRGGNTINITDGYLISNIQTAGYASCGIYLANADVVNISGGTIVGNTCSGHAGAGIVKRAGDLNITGGTILGLGDTNATGKVGDSRVVIPSSGVVLDITAGYPGLDVANDEINIEGGEVTGNKEAVSLVDQNNNYVEGGIEVSGGTSWLPKEPVTTPERVYKIMIPLLKGLDHEECWVLFLNKAQRLIARERMTRGGSDATTIDVKDILRKSLDHGARGIVLIHNHPSDNPLPGQADIAMTKALQKAARSMDLFLLDHVIVCDSCYYSFTDDRMCATPLKDNSARVLTEAETAL